MNQADVLQEVTALSDEDCFLVVQHHIPNVSYPPHIHPEFELSYLENAAGAIRIVGESIEEMEDLDLLLVAGGTRHAYSNHICLRSDILGIMIQFDSTLFDSLIHKRHFRTIRDMFDRASCGVVFSREMILKIQPELKMLSESDSDSFDNLLRLIGILKYLSCDNKARSLNAVNTVENFNNRESDKLDTILLFLHENYQRSLTLPEVSSLINMSEASLTRFLKKWTGKTFIDNLNDIRISEASSCLIDTSDTIAEICYKCGFNNLSNFNRIFRKRKGCTPTQYRAQFARTRFRV